MKLRIVQIPNGKYEVQKLYTKITYSLFKKKTDTFWVHYFYREPWWPFPIKDPEESIFSTFWEAEMFVKMLTEEQKVVKEYEI